MGVGSVATRLLADFGADVIKIEDRQRIDTPRKLPIYKGEPARNFGEEVIDADPNRGGLFDNYCRNKLGVTINMRVAKGRQLAERLIAESSIVSENFAPGVMARWGLTYRRLFLLQSADEAYLEGQARKLPIGVLNRPDDLVHDPHLQARKFFVEVEDADGSPALHPGVPFRFSGFGPVPLQRAPKLGEHTAEVLGTLAIDEEVS